MTEELSNYPEPIGDVIHPLPTSNLKTVLINQKWRMELRIESGSFGDVYVGKDIHTDQLVAIKLESEHADSKQLEHEYEVYKALDGSVGFPKCYSFGPFMFYKYMIQDYLGPSLETLHEFMGRKFSEKTVLMIGVQMIDRLECLHNHNYIHRDLKPDNMLVGHISKTSIHLIDFGLAKSYMVKTEHQPMGRTKAFVGTRRYGSINAHMKNEQSRRDDLESLGYVLIYLLKGKLPWSATRKKKRPKTEFIMETKKSVDLNRKCDGLATELITYMKYCRELQYEECPDYDYLKQLLLQRMELQNYKFDAIFDWIENDPFKKPV